MSSNHLRMRSGLGVALHLTGAALHSNPRPIRGSLENKTFIAGEFKNPRRDFFLAVLFVFAASGRPLCSYSFSAHLVEPGRVCSTQVVVQVLGWVRRT